MYPLFELPPDTEHLLEKRLLKLGHSLKEPEKLALAVRRLSNHFLKENYGDYWSDRDYRAAYITYFATLNFLRARAVFREARHRHFFLSTHSVSDWGSGAGSALWAFMSEWRETKIPLLSAADQSPTALEELQEWAKLYEIKTQAHRASLSDVTKTKSDTLLLSYVLNEVELWPEIPKSVRRLVVIEPSTHQAGRRLLKWRDDILRSGEWFAWAPCTHQQPCPLLNQSGKDWCHHRIHWNKPGWFFDLEKYLPMRNETLTLTYLLLSRDKPKQDLSGIARVVGDEQEEKGKTRQMICRGPNREFLSWLHRDQISLKLQRGDLLNFQGALEPRGGELRIFSAETVVKLPEE